MDVEHEARSHPRPLKRQAEAAERTAKLVNETNELRARIVADEPAPSRRIWRRRNRRPRFAPGAIRSSGASRRCGREGRR